MPLHFCHPNTPHRKLRMPEWFVSSLMMDRALDAIVRRAKTLDRKHDIPYLAGYSRDGKTIYIDRHMPPSFRFRGRTIETDRFLLLHEEVEKTLIDDLGLLRRMEAAVERGYLPPARGPVAVRGAIKKVKADIVARRDEGPGRGAKRGRKKI